uniref:Uncharacterized protein n=1 Tax=Spumella elongata TaxID=89044 RepID=A0A7S3H489_9STRA
MGATASTLTSEQKIALTKHLQRAYNQLSDDRLEDDIVKDSMLREYNVMVMAMHKSKCVDAESTATFDHAKEVTFNMSTSITEPVLVKQLSRSLSTSLKNKKATKFSRRRSFDQASKHEKSKSQIAAAAEVASRLSAAPEDVVDSWDSVTHQPFCTTCQMAFKSQDFLDRHVKFSDLHAKNLEKAKGVIAVDKNPITSTDAGVGMVQQSQVEGVHYKLLYTGSKFFWRTQMNIEIDMYLHLLPYVIEVISFDPIKDHEATRIYLNYYTIQSTLEKLVSSDLEAAKLKELAEQRFHSHGEEAESVLREHLLLQRVVTYILQRLQLDTTGGAGELMYVEEYGDGDLKSPLLTDAPLALVPVSLTRRRHTTAGEIESTINNIAVDHTAIDQALTLAASYEQASDPHEMQVQAANRIAAHVHAAAEHMANRKMHPGVSIPKKRFIQAARKVIRQALVAKTKAEMVRREKKVHVVGGDASSHAHKHPHHHHGKAPHRPHEA